MAEKTSEIKNKLPNLSAVTNPEGADFHGEANEAFGKALDAVDDAEEEAKIMLVLDSAILSDLWEGVVEACEKAGGWRPGARNAIYEALEELNIHLNKREKEEILPRVLRAKLGLPPSYEGHNRLQEWDQVGFEIVRQSKNKAYGMRGMKERMMQNYGQAAARGGQDDSSEEIASKKEKKGGVEEKTSGSSGEGVFLSGTSEASDVTTHSSNLEVALSWPELKDSAEGYLKRMEESYFDLAKLQVMIAKVPPGYAEGVYHCMLDFFGHLWKVKIPLEEKGNLSQGLKRYITKITGVDLPDNGKLAGVRDALNDEFSQEAIFKNLEEIPADLPPVLQRVIFSNFNEGIKTSKGVIHYLAWIFKSYSVEENHIASPANEEVINDHLLFVASQKIYNEISETWHTGAELPPAEDVITRLEHEEKNNSDLPLDANGMIPLDILIQPGGMEDVMAKIKEQDDGWSEFIAGRKATQKAEEEKQAQAEEIRLTEEKAQEHIPEIDQAANGEKGAEIIAQNEISGIDNEGILVNDENKRETIIPNSKPIVLGGGNDPFTEV